MNGYKEIAYVSLSENRRHENSVYSLGSCHGRNRKIYIKVWVESQSLESIFLVSQTAVSEVYIKYKYDLAYQDEVFVHCRRCYALYRCSSHCSPSLWFGCLCWWKQQ